MERTQKALLNRQILSCCDVEELLDSYLDREIEPELEKRFNAHVSRCRSCGGLVEDCQTIVSTARSLAETPLPEDVSIRLRKSLFEKVGHYLPAQPRLTVVKP